MLLITLKLDPQWLLKGSNQFRLQDAAAMRDTLLAAFPQVQPAYAVLVHASFDTHEWLMDLDPKSGEEAAGNILAAIRSVFSLQDAQASATWSEPDGDQLNQWREQADRMILPAALKMQNVQVLDRLIEAGGSEKCGNREALRNLQPDAPGLRKQPGDRGRPDGSALVREAHAVEATRPVDSLKTTESADASDKTAANAAAAEFAGCDGLLGFDAFKREIQMLGRVYAQRAPSAPKLPHPNYLFVAPPGCDCAPLVTILHDAVRRFGVLDLEPSDTLLEYRIPDMDRMQAAELVEHFSKHCVGGGRHLLVLHLTSVMLDAAYPADAMLAQLLPRLEDYMIVFILETEQESLKKRFEAKLRDLFQLRTLPLDPPDDECLCAVILERLSEMAVQVEDEPGVRDQLMGLLQLERRDGSFRYLQSAERLVREIAWHVAETRAAASDADRPVTAEELSALAASHPNRIDERGGIALDQMIGLAGIKTRVREISAYCQWAARMRESGVPIESPGLHMLFTGSAGTGKTEVARNIGRIFKAMGILKKGEFHEVSRKDLVAPYVGQTAARTARVCERAVGSVLFIDEAYALAQGGENDFGAEALATLIAYMENYRHDMIVILAGYREEMDAFLDVNPGMRSRIAYPLHFPDYSPNELTQIYLKHLGSSFDLEPGLEAAAGNWFETLASGKEPRRDAGNGRLARNLAERTHMKLAFRLAQNVRQVADDPKVQQGTAGAPGDSGPRVSEPRRICVADFAAAADEIAGQLQCKTVGPSVRIGF